MKITAEEFQEIQTAFPSAILCGGWVVLGPMTVWRDNRKPSPWRYHYGTGPYCPRDRYPQVDGAVTLPQCLNAVRRTLTADRDHLSAALGEP